MVQNNIEKNCSQQNSLEGEASGLLASRLLKRHCIYFTMVQNNLYFNFIILETPSQVFSSSVIFENKFDQPSKSPKSLVSADGGASFGKGTDCHSFACCF